MNTKNFSTACRHASAACLAGAIFIVQSAAADANNIAPVANANFAPSANAAVVGASAQTNTNASLKIIFRSATTNFLPNGKMVITNKIVRARSSAETSGTDAVGKAVARNLERAAKNSTETPSYNLPSGEKELNLAGYGETAYTSLADSAFLNRNAIGIHGGYHTWSESNSGKGYAFQIETRYNLPETLLDIYIAGSFSDVENDDYDYKMQSTQLRAMLQYAFQNDSSVTPYAGAGVFWERAKSEYSIYYPAYYSFYGYRTYFAAKENVENSDSGLAPIAVIGLEFILAGGSALKLEAGYLGKFGGYDGYGGDKSQAHLQADLRLPVSDICSLDMQVRYATEWKEIYAFGGLGFQF